MLQYKTQFDAYMGVKNIPNEHEIYLFKRAKKYISWLSKTPGVEMIAVVNSLSMNATHEDSDIDLFIITRPGNIWFVRFFSTLILWICGVWRKGKDIRENFCLSFFITTEAMNLEKIAIDNDIYLAHWIYYMKPIYDAGGVYEIFIKANHRLLSSDEKLFEFDSFFGELFESVERSFGKNLKRFGIFEISKTSSEQIPKGTNKRRTFGTFGHKSTYILNSLIRSFILPRTLKSYEKIGKPEGVIISDTMLKFHDRDRRREIRDAILEKNFDK